MLAIYVIGNPRPAGGIPRAVDGYQFFGFVPDSPALGVINDAIALIGQRLAAPGVMDSCNTAFRAIRNVSFQDLFTGPTVVNVYRSTTAPSIDDYALTEGSGLARHITLTRNCWGLSDRGRAVLRTAATLVHEMAHCAGAAAAPSIVAEQTLVSCGFADKYDPTARG